MLLVVQVSEEEASEVGAFIATVGGVISVEAHGEDGHCCCKNCPWNGNHGQ